MKAPKGFNPPRVTKFNDGVKAFYAYDWYYRGLQEQMKFLESLFLVPCAGTKPIPSSPMHRNIYQKYMRHYARGREIFVVSEPCVLIFYADLVLDAEHVFDYDFPPKFLDHESRALFVGRLKRLLAGKDITGCLPKHHASLVNEAIGTDWLNFWEGDMFQMYRRAALLDTERSVK